MGWATNISKSTRDICVTHVHGRVAPVVVTLFGRACVRFRVVSHWPLNDALNRIVLTFKYAENVDYVPMGMWVNGVGQQGRLQWREWQGPRCNPCATGHNAGGWCTC